MYSVRKCVRAAHDLPRVSYRGIDQYGVESNGVQTNHNPRRVRGHVLWKKTVDLELCEGRASGHDEAQQGALLPVDYILYVQARQIARDVTARLEYA